MKRILDVVGSTLGLLILSPIILVVSLLVRIKLGTPVFFRQVRPGLNEEPFTLIKFRTMADAFSADGSPLPDEERLTDFGNALRRTSLDELPELWHVMMGDMSIVGPRPLLTHYLDFYSDHQRRRHEMRPGLTGWAQVNGRNEVPWPDRLEMDVWYVDNHTLWLDMRIIGKTLISVFTGEGVSQEALATVEYFAGYDS